VNLTNLIFPRLFLMGLWMATASGDAQTPSVQPYVLLSGSKLADSCPICGRPSIIVPLTGTFGLQLLDQNPLLTRYELTNILFHTGATSGLPYQVLGGGVYQVGGEVAVTQELFLNAEISNGSTIVNAMCVSTNGAVIQPWPKIQVQVDQTNGTAAQVYNLTLVAVPAPQVRSIRPDLQTDSVLLQWDENGSKFQLERAPNVAGPYSAVTPITTNSSFIDMGVLTNSARFFYRLQTF